MERALALEARVPVDALRGGALDDVSRASVGAAALRLRDLPLQVRSLSGQRFTEVSEALDTVPRRALLVIDSLQMTAPPATANGPDEAVAGAARALKALALDHDVAVLVLAQLPGLKPSRRDPRPSLEDLGGLGVVKQVADVVLAIYREEMYRPAGGVGRSDRAHRGQESQRHDRFCRPLLLPRMAAVRGYGRTGEIILPIELTTEPWPRRYRSGFHPPRWPW